MQFPATERPASDAIKAILAGAHAVQLVSVLLKHGPRIISTLLHDMQRWGEVRGVGCRRAGALGS